MKKFVIALCLTLFIAPISLAADAAHLDLIGFSKNGAYVAFTQFGVRDPSGFPYVYTSFVAVKTNRLESELRGEISVGGATTEQVRVKMRAQVAVAMKKYGIIVGNQGRFIGVTPMRINTTNSEFFALGNTYGLDIANKPAVNTNKMCDTTPQLLIVELTVGGQTRDLQRDTRLPASRRCAFDYELRSAHLYGRSLAVFVSYMTPGYEGPDFIWMVVTGML